MPGKKNILLIGPMPPPSGGVSVHLSRLLKKAKENPHLILAVFDLRRLKIYYSDASTGNIFSAFMFFLSAKIIHIHLSHPVKVFIARISRLFGKKVFYTQHNPRELFLSSTQSVIKLSEKAIFVFDQGDLPKNGIVIPAYIKSEKSGQLPAGLEEEIKKYKKVIVSVRSDVADSTEKEDLYGFDLILESVKNILFKESILIVLVDSTGSSSERYENEIRSANKVPGIKIIYIDYDIDFPELLSKSHIFIRASRSDGDSLSVREALDSGVHVIASDCSVRPEGCKSFRSRDAYELSALLLEALELNNSPIFKQEDYSEGIFELYKSVTFKAK